MFLILLYWRLPKGKPIGPNENIMLECSWVGKPTGGEEASLYAEDS